MRRMSMALLAIPTAVGIAVAVGTSASAAVTFDSATGVGFVGKGDVQTAFAWNNAQVQQNAAGVAFSYEATDTYAAVCEWITGEGTRGQRTHHVTHERSASVTSAVAYEARTNKQISGFNLTGYGAVTETGTVPAVGDACPGNEGHAGEWVTVTLAGSTGGLFVTSAGTSVPLS